MWGVRMFISLKDYLLEVQWDTKEEGEAVSKIYGDTNLTDKRNGGKEWK